MFSVEGVKFTTARRVAERVTDRLVAALGHPARPCRTADTPLVEGDEPESSLEARVRRAVRTEMAERLGDIFRRLAPGGRPGAGADLDVVARLAALELGWTEQRKDAEIEAVKRSISQPGSPPERVA
jgi:glycerol-3-phosphate dehydrogenase